MGSCPSISRPAPRPLIKGHVRSKYTNLIEVNPPAVRSKPPNNPTPKKLENKDGRMNFVLHQIPPGPGKPPPYKHTGEPVFGGGEGLLAELAVPPPSTDFFRIKRFDLDFKIGWKISLLDRYVFPFGSENFTVLFFSWVGAVCPFAGALFCRKVWGPWASIVCNANKACSCRRKLGGGEFFFEIISG